MIKIKAKREAKPLFLFLWSRRNARLYVTRSKIECVAVILWIFARFSI